MDTQPKKSFFKKFWWLISIIIIIVVVFMGATFRDKKNGDSDKEKNLYKVINNNTPVDGSGDPKKTGRTLPFSAAQLTAADAAFASGIKIEDPEDDFFIYTHNRTTDTYRGNNTSPYPMPFTDLKSLSVGADNQYMYLKFEYWGKLPTDHVSYDGDYIISHGGKLDEIFYKDKNGQDKVDAAHDGIGYYTVSENGEYAQIDPVANVMSFITRNGKDASGEDAFLITSMNGMLAGGLGYDYTLSARPLSELGFKLGDEISFRCSTETGSVKHHHEAIEFLLGRETEGFIDGSLIRYKLGENTYEVAEEPKVKDDKPETEENK
ncbi:MAG: hypothetical protein WC528_03420 [Patescibacteria group bacterium]